MSLVLGRNGGSSAKTLTQPGTKHARPDSALTSQIVAVTTSTVLQLYVLD